MTAMREETIDSLTAKGYIEPRLLSDGRWVAGLRLAFTFAVVVGHVDDPYGYADRWCYTTALESIAALMAWDGHGEPVGWIRHPRSGRRISRDDHTYDGDGNLIPIGQEYVRR